MGKFFITVPLFVQRVTYDRHNVSANGTLLGSRFGPFVLSQNERGSQVISKAHFSHILESSAYPSYLTKMPVAFVER
jgi:hypothetical protein